MSAIDNKEETKTLPNRSFYVLIGVFLFLSCSINWENKKTSLGQNVGQRRFVNILASRVTINVNHELQVEINLYLLNLFDDDFLDRFEGKNKNKVAPAGIHPGWRDDS